jgi:hypothetical protein
MRVAWIGARGAGLVLATAVIAAVSLLGYVLVLGRGPTVAVMGEVRSFTLREDDMGSYPMARVWVDGRMALVGIPRSQRCRRGDQIALGRRRSLVGYQYTMRPEGCLLGRG